MNIEFKKSFARDLKKKAQGIKLRSRVKEIIHEVDNAESPKVFTQKWDLPILSIKQKAELISSPTFHEFQDYLLFTFFCPSPYTLCAMPYALCERCMPFVSCHIICMKLPPLNNHLFSKIWLFIYLVLLFLLYKNSFTCLLYNHMFILYLLLKQSVRIANPIWHINCL